MGEKDTQRIRFGCDGASLTKSLPEVVDACQRVYFAATNFPRLRGERGRNCSRGLVKFESSYGGDRHVHDQPCNRSSWQDARCRVGAACNP